MSDEAPYPGDPLPLHLIDNTRITPIVLDDAHGRWEFAPLADITPLESVLIAQLFTAIVVRRGRQDWREYLTRDWYVRGTANSDFNALPCELARHFRNLE